MLRYTRLDAEFLTKDQFVQIVDIEASCGLNPYTPDMLMDCIVNLDTFACFAGNRVVGFITMNRRSSCLGGSLYMVNLNVARAFRGKGIAKRLMYTAYEYYIQENTEMMVSLDVAKTNKAMELYKQVGFQIVDMPSRNGETDVVMAIPLAVLGDNLRMMLQAR